jgi:pimeloyl-ACP methyl ester carboxylesterase
MSPMDDGYGSGPHPDWLEIDWSAHLKWLEVEDRAVNVLDVGSGPALVFIHGHSGCWQHWLEQIPAFMNDHRVIALDLPGFGRSEMPREGVSMQTYGRVVEDVCTQLDVGPACVVGNSMGGFVAAETAIQSPARVERLVLVAAAGMAAKYIGLPTELIRNPGAAAGGRVLFSLLGLPEPQARRIAARPRGRRAVLRFVARYPERLNPALVYELIRGAGRPAAAPAAVDLATYDFSDRVPEIGCPTLIVWGDRDYLVPLSSAKSYAEAIEDASMVVYDETGHIPMIERPGRFNADLAAFLRDEQVGERPARAIAHA